MCVCVNNVIDEAPIVGLAKMQPDWASSKEMQPTKGASDTKCHLQTRTTPSDNSG